MTHPDDPERRPSVAQQLAGTMFAPAPVDTRLAAFEATRDEAARLRTRCLDALARHGDLTADECAAVLGESVLAIRPRFSEMLQDGQIEDAGTRRKNRSGHTAKVWRRVGRVHADPA